MRSKPSARSGWQQEHWHLGSKGQWCDMTQAAAQSHRAHSGSGSSRMRQVIQGELLLVGARIKREMSTCTC
jgi:hypothetical protein